MKSFEKFESENRRLQVLQMLEQDTDYTLNETVLQAGLRAMGHAVSSDLLRSELAWLTEQGLVSVQDVSGLQVARLSRRGADIALGHARTPGVARPRPDE